MILDYDLRYLAWQKTEDGAKNRNPPEPVAPPPYAHEIKAAEARVATKAEKYLARQRRRTA